MTKGLTNVLDKFLCPQ